MRALITCAVLCVCACAKKEAKTVTGSATPTDAAAFQLPPGHPALDMVGQVATPTGTTQPITDVPPDGAGHRPIRMSVDQVRAALLGATGQVWKGRLVVADPNSTTGQTLVNDADMLESFASSLGRPDFNTSVNEAHEPGVTFSKLVSDAARFTCRAAVTADSQQSDVTQRVILHSVGPADTTATHATAVRANIVYLGLRFWGRTLDPASPEVDQLVRVFDRVSTAAATQDDAGTPRPAGTPLDGWRLVCIAMATDTRFLSY